MFAKKNNTHTRYNLPNNRYRLVNIADRDELELWHGYDDLIATENTGISLDCPWKEKGYDKNTRDFFKAEREKAIDRYSSFFAPYFILCDGQISGTFALPRDTSTYQMLLIQSLYILPDFRGRSLAKKTLNDLYDLALSINMSGVRLQTEYPWKSAVHFYLHNRYWLLHWNDCLNFIRTKDLPEYRVEEGRGCLKFCVNKKGYWRTLITARNDGESLCWENYEVAGIDEHTLLTATTTLSLHLAMCGWPLARSGKHHWMDGDCGGPEALATQIAYWESPLSEMDDWKEHTDKLKKLESNSDQQ